jgi:hypothetical protein
VGMISLWYTVLIATAEARQFLKIPAAFLALGRDDIVMLWDSVDLFWD